MQVTSTPRGFFTKRYQTTIKDVVNGVAIDIKIVKPTRLESVHQAWKAYESAYRAAMAF